LLTGEEEELVVIEPKENTFALVYRDKVEDNKGILHFTKFINHLAPSPLYQCSLIYRIDTI